MNEPLNFSVETKKNIPQTLVPNGVSQNIFDETHLPNTFHTVDDLKSFDDGKEMETVYQQIFSFANFLTVNEIEGKPHLYYIPIYNIEFYDQNEEIGFEYISDIVLDDVRNGRSKIVLHATDEGYFGAEVDTTLETIDNWRINSNLPKNSVIFINGNLISQSIVERKKLGILCIGTSILSEEYLNYDVLDEDIIGYKPERLFLCYNRNSHSHRVYMGTKMYQEGLISKGLVSYHNFVSDEQRKMRREELTDHFDDDIIDSFFSTLPLRINEIDGHSKDINFNIGQEIFPQDYLYTFVSLVTETTSFSDAIYCSEKTFKPIAMGHPFFIFGSQGTLTELKKMGYKTFDKWWSEEYDCQDNYVDRANMILYELHKLNSMSKNKLIGIRKEMETTLKHNKNLFNQRVKQKNQHLYDIFKTIYKTLL